MADADSTPNMTRKPLIRVNHRQILEVALVPNVNRCRIPSNDRIVPYTGVAADRHVSQDDGTGGNKCCGIDGEGSRQHPNY